MNSWTIAYVLLAVAFAYFFWIIIRPEVRRMGRKRKLALALAAPYALAIFLMGLVALFTPSHLPGIFSSQLGARTWILWSVVNSAASAVVIVEMIRITFRRTSGWSDKVHFIVVALSWVLLFALQSFLVSAAIRDLR